MSVNRTSQPANNAIKPDAPTSVSAVANAGTTAGTAGTVTVSFTPSVNPGKGSANYVATSTPGSVTASAASSPITFAAGSLTASTSYTFSVVKQSGSGVTSDSTASGTAVPYTVPPAPASLSAARQASQTVRLAFTAPANNGGRPITDYQYSTDSGVNWRSIGSTSSPFDATLQSNGSALVNGTAYTFILRAVNAAGGGTASSGASATPYTTPSAPSITFTNTDNDVDWSWVSGGDGGNSITLWEYSVSTNNGSYPTPDTQVAVTTTGYPDTINNYRNTNYYKLRVRAYNSAGWGPYAESANSTGWTRTLGNEVTETTYDAYTNSGCDSLCCNGCGTQAYRRRKYSQRQTRTDTWTRGSSNNTEYVVVTNYTGDTNGDGTVDNWGLVSTYTDCGIDGSCVTSATSTVSGYDGQIVYVGGPANRDYRVYSSYFGAWAVCNSSGTYTWQVGQCGGSCTSQNCFVFSTSITQCNASPCQTYTAVGYAQLGLCGNFGFGCTGVASC